MTMTRGDRKHVTGVVTSDAMDKSVVVEVKRLVKHPLYGKYLRRRTKLMAHDEENSAHVGDTVELAESRPMSKCKSWRVVQVLKRAVGSQDVDAEVPEVAVETTETTSTDSNEGEGQS